MTKLIGFGRCLGKTTMAILESHATGHYIVCANRKHADNTFRFAKELGYTIPYPLSVSDTRFRFTDGRKQSNEPVIIDDVEMILQAMLGCPIDTITFDSPNVISTKDRYAEEIAELKKELAACYMEKEEDQGSIKRLRSICISQQNIINGQDLDKMTKSAIIKKRNRRRFAR